MTLPGLLLLLGLWMPRLLIRVHDGILIPLISVSSDPVPKSLERAESFASVQLLWEMALEEEWDNYYEISLLWNSKILPEGNCPPLWLMDSVAEKMARVWKLGDGLWFFPSQWLTSAFCLPILAFYLKKNIYLAAPGLSWGTQDLQSSLRHVESLVNACKLYIIACGI